MKDIYYEYINIFIIFFIIFFSTYIFGFISINPIDNFTNYNSGLLIFNGNIPFKDYWVTTGPLLDFIQFIIFKINGLNWSSYTIHSALLNSIFSCLIYYVFRNFHLAKKYSFVYSTLTGIIFYTQVGNPFVDHHSSLFSILAILYLILGINFKKNVFWFLIPIFLILAFFSKQTPSGYFLFLVFLVVFYNFLFNRNITNISYSFLSSLLIIILTLAFFNYYQIKFEDFYNQYILFASSVGKIRFQVDGFLKPFEFSRYFLKFKWLHISYFLLIFIIIKNFRENKFFFKTSDFITIFTLISSVYILIFHQLLTLNVKFIYFLIPIMCGFTHVYLKKIFIKNQKKLLNFNFLILFISCFYYFSSYVINQKFQLFCYENVKEIKPIKTKIIDDKNFFYWKSCLQKNPNQELTNLKSIISYLEKRDKNYILVTDYQFINFKLKNNKNIQINKWYHPGVSYPIIDGEIFEYYKEFVFKIMKNKDIKKIIFVYPSHFNNENEVYFKKFFSGCMKNQQSLINGLVKSIDIEKCFN